MCRSTSCPARATASRSPETPRGTSTCRGRRCTPPESHGGRRGRSLCSRAGCQSPCRAGWPSWCSISEWLSGVAQPSISPNSLMAFRLKGNLQLEIRGRLIKLVEPTGRPRPGAGSASRPTVSRRCDAGFASHGANHACAAHISGATKPSFSTMHRLGSSARMASRMAMVSGFAQRQRRSRSARSIR